MVYVSFSSSGIMIPGTSAQGGNDSLSDVLILITEAFLAFLFLDQLNLYAPAPPFSMRSRASSDPCELKMIPCSSTMTKFGLMLNTISPQGVSIVAYWELASPWCYKLSLNSISQLCRGVISFFCSVCQHCGFSYESQPLLHVDIMWHLRDIG